jgi:gamma-glutamyltranspeptidase/glutathione hydrolase
MKAKSATGMKAAVAAGHPLATAAAVEALEDGGNAVDGALAGAVVLATVLPQACAIGGDCFALVHAGGRTHGINGSGAAPHALPPGVTAEQLAWGPLSCAVPGMVGGWENMHRRFGRRPWRAAFEPAIRLARDGFPVGRDLARAIRENLERLRLDPGIRSLYLENGAPLAEGATLRQPALADTLAALADEGGKALYDGAVGRRLAAAVADRGGALRAADLEAYAPLEVEPLAVGYRGHTVRAMPPNSYGLVMLMQLAALDGVELRRHAPGSVERWRLLMLAARAGFRLGRPFLADPGKVAGRLHAALSPAMLAELRAALAAAPAAPTPPGSAHGTAVISVADHGGDGVAIVQSVFAPFGSLVADADTGIVLNNRLMGFTPGADDVNAPAPGKRPAHTLNPGMVFDKDGRLAMVLTTPGGSGQTITLTQVVTNVIDYGMTLDAAIAAPRWSMDLKGNFALEEEAGADVAGRLAALGIEARMAAPEQRFFFGSAECVMRNADGSFTAAADFRREADAAAI